MFGFLNCNKPLEFSSRDLVNVVQGRLRGRKVKVGHCGTLDPLADGVLIIGVGPAAKLVPYVHETSKCYRGQFKLGAESPTGDLEVEPTELEGAPEPTLQQLQTACHSLTGRISQVPPNYSAIKVGGKRAYDLARQGKIIEMPSRQVMIHSLTILAYQYPMIELEITCGTGTYIRTLGMDLAKAIGSVAVMTALTRTRVGEFPLSDSVSLDQLRQADLETLLQPASLGVSHLPRLTVEQDDCLRLVHGQPLSEELSLQPGDHGSAPVNRVPDQDIAAALRDDGHLKGIVKMKDGRWWPKRVFPD